MGQIIAIPTFEHGRQWERPYRIGLRDPKAASLCLTGLGRLAEGATAQMVWLASFFSSPWEPATPPGRAPARFIGQGIPQPCCQGSRRTDLRRIVAQHFLDCAKLNRGRVRLLVLQLGFLAA